MPEVNQSIDEIFTKLITAVQTQQSEIRSLKEHILKLESIGSGGGGSASIEDYEPEKTYKRNVLVVDRNTETVYRVIDEYVSDTIETDRTGGHLKLVGFESQIVTFNHRPTQTEIDALPEDVLVAVYSATDDPYDPAQNVGD